MRTLLLVEDERDILENNRRFFEAEGYHVLTAENLTQAKERLSTEAPGAIVLDIMLPDGSGLDLLSELRTAGNKIPIIMLTAWGKPSDIARGLKQGANDYVSKPFEYEVLLARVEAMFRSAEQVPERVTLGSLAIDVLSGQAFVNGMDLVLTKKEFALLLITAQHEGRRLSAEYLHEKVWGGSEAGGRDALKYQISRLRKKLKNSGYTISVSRGQGYCLERE